MRYMPAHAPFPKITCSKAYAGREKIVAAFERYYDENGPLSASHFVKAGQASNGYYLSVNNQARLDAVNGHAILANTTPSFLDAVSHVVRRFVTISVIFVGT